MFESFLFEYSNKSSTCVVYRVDVGGSEALPSAKIGVEKQVSFVVHNEMLHFQSPSFSYVMLFGGNK